MTAYLIDTDVLIDNLRGAQAFALPDGSTGAYSVLTRAELYSGRRAVEQPVEALLSQLEEIGLDPATANRAGLIRRTPGVALADAIIAATAIEAGKRADHPEPQALRPDRRPGGRRTLTTQGRATQ